MYNILLNLMEERHITPYRLSKETGITQATLSRWKNGKTEPSIETLRVLAGYFNVTVDFLTGNEQKNKPALIDKDELDITFDDFTYAFLDESKELTEENKAKLLEMAKFFKQQQDKEKGNMK